jgi:hypothetical protein
MSNLHASLLTLVLFHIFETTKVIFKNISRHFKNLKEKNKRKRKKQIFTIESK